MQEIQPEKGLSLGLVTLLSSSSTILKAYSMLGTEFLCNTVSGVTVSFPRKEPAVAYRSQRSNKGRLVTNPFTSSRQKVVITPGDEPRINFTNGQYQRGRFGC